MNLFDSVSAMICILASHVNNINLASILFSITMINREVAACYVMLDMLYFVSISKCLRVLDSERNIINLCMLINPPSNKCSSEPRLATRRRSLHYGYSIKVNFFFCACQ